MKDEIYEVIELDNKAQVEDTIFDLYIQLVYGKNNSTSDKRKINRDIRFLQTQLKAMR